MSTSVSVLLRIVNYCSIRPPYIIFVVSGAT